MAANPLVSIGLPVYNGENYLRESLNSILAQSYENIEVVIVDNASSDSTQAICEGYAASDTRIRYVRNEENIGAAGNYNAAFGLSTGDYFKWAAHDDLLHVDYLARCMELLLVDPNAALCHSRTGQIDQASLVTSHEYVTEHGVLPAGLTASQRFRRLTQDKGSWTRIFGVIRRDIIETTPLIDHYTGSDLTLLGEIGMRGDVLDINEILFWRREHETTSTQGEFRARRRRLVWFNSARKPSINFPEWKLNSMMLASLRRQPLPLKEKLKCAIHVLERCVIKRKLLLQDIVYPVLDTFGVDQRILTRKRKSRSVSNAGDLTGTTTNRS